MNAQIQPKVIFCRVIPFPLSHCVLFPVTEGFDQRQRGLNTIRAAGARAFKFILYSDISI